MKIISAFISLALLGSLSAQGAVFASNGSASDVQSKINSASDGDTVTIPSGSFTWSSGVTISGKGIKIQGAGTGGILGTSTSSVAIGTGSKSFTTQSGLGLSNGDAVTIYVKNVYQASSPSYVKGTVSSYSGTSLTVNVTATSGSGTYGFWYVTLDAQTIIMHSAGSANLFSVTPDTTHSVEFTGLKFIEGGSASNGQHLRVNHNAGSKLVHVYNCWFSTSGGMLRAIEWVTNGGLIYRCYFDEDFKLSVDEAIVFKPVGLTTSWTTAATWGANDTQGTANTYVEDCFFANIAYSAMDVDDNARAVVRYNTFDNTGWGSHGKDTSPHGMRHCEVYNNTFVFQDMGTHTVNLNWTVYMRGGSWVITDNVMPDITSSAWGNKPELVATIFSIRRNTSYIATTYPAAHQVGRGYTTGTDLVNGDLESIYSWNNSGFSGSSTILASDYQPDEVGNGLTMVGSGFWQEGRDYIYGAKPDYSKYTYPHPLRSGSVPVQEPPSIAANPQNVVSSQGQSASFTVSVIGSTPLSYQWQKNSGNIAGATSPTYTISSAQTNDAGNYRCVVTNAYGSATSAVATLTVNVPVPVPASVLTNPQSLTRTVGQSATFTVTAAGDAPLAYQWQKNLANIAGATSASYTIASVQTNDAGSFRCLVTNAFGSVTSTTATLTVNAAAAGNVRYVDFVSGNDSNPGTAVSPWRRCPGMVGWTGSATLQPGDTVYFNRRRVWDIGASSGTNPGLDLKAGVHYIGDQWDPQGVGPKRAVLRAVGRHEAGNVRFWQDHATIPTEIEGFEIDGNGYRANGIDINHSFWTTGLTDAVKRVKNCVVHGQTGNGSEGDYKYGIIVSDNSPDASGWAANVEILDTVVYNVPRVGISIYPSDTGMLSNIVVRGCEVYNTTGDPSYTQSTHGIGFKGDIRNSVVEYCYVHDVGGAALFISGPEATGNGAPTGLKVRYNILQSTAQEGVIRFYSSGTKSVDIYGNLVLQNEINGGLSFSGNSGTITARIYNNTFYNSYVNIGNPTSTGTIEFRNNLIYELDDIALTDAGSKITAHSNNIFYRANGGTRVRIGSVNYNATSITNWEPTAKTTNPLFKDVANLPNGFIMTAGGMLIPNTDGLSLQDGSPALNAGADIGVVFNGSINGSARPAGSPWDIGAYQRLAATAPPAPPKNLLVIE